MKIFMCQSYNWRLSWAPFPHPSEGIQNQSVRSFDKHIQQQTRYKVFRTFMTQFCPDSNSITRRTQPKLNRPTPIDTACKMKIASPWIRMHLHCCYLVVSAFYVTTHQMQSRYYIGTTESLSASKIWKYILWSIPKQRNFATKSYHPTECYISTQWHIHCGMKLDSYNSLRSFDTGPLGFMWQCEWIDW